MSASFSLDSIDYKKIGKGILIAGGGAVLTYLLGELPNVDFGQYTALVVAVLSSLINAGLKFIESQK